MMNNLIIVCTSCRFNRKFTMKRTFPFNSLFDISNKNFNYFNLVNNVVRKNIEKGVSVTMFSGGNK